MIKFNNAYLFFNEIFVLILQQAERYNIFSICFTYLGY